MVMVIAAEVVELPATSVATAVSLCVPLVTPLVFQLKEYGLLVSVASTVVPSRWNVTLAIPDGAPDPVPRSVAPAVTVTLVPCVTLVPEAGEVIETVGAAASIWITCDLTASLLPAVSTEKYLTVVVRATVNGPVYLVLELVGVDPLVV